MNNQRQIVVATMMYVQDSNEAFFPDPVSRAWSTYLKPYNEPSLYDCPSKTGIGTNDQPEYGFNYTIAGMALGDIKTPSTSLVITDANPSAMNSMIYGGQDWDKQRHDNKALAAFADGHVEIISSLKIVPIGSLAWLSGDSVTLNGATVSSWDDTSGNKLNATGTGNSQPTLVSKAQNGQPALLFDGVDDYMRFPSSGFNDFSQGICIFAVAKPTVLAGWYNFIFASFGTTSGVQDNYISLNGGFLADADGNNMSLQVTNGINGVPGGYGNIHCDGTLVVNEYHLYGAMIRANASASLYKDKAKLSAPPSTAPLPIVAERAQTVIGADQNWAGGIAGGNYKGELAELVIYNRGLNDTEVKSITWYLMDKYALR
ncbi:MAG: LamG-like jellyroll fold domain-containing protein [Armatimonadota bacterium]